MARARLYMVDEWVPGRCYHIIGKAVAGERLFLDHDDYRRFLRISLRRKLYDILEIHVYCLLPNHFHLVVRTRSREDILGSLHDRVHHSRWTPSDLAFEAGELPYRVYVYRRFNGAINGYAKYFNARYGRTGKLFQYPTLHGATRKGAEGGEFSRTMCAYVGLNYFKHRLAGAQDFYHYSSLRHPLYDIVELDVVLYFGSEQAYKDFHTQYLLRYGARLENFDEEDFYQHLQPRKYVRGRWVEGEWRPGLG